MFICFGHYFDRDGMGILIDVKPETGGKTSTVYFPTAELAEKECRELEKYYAHLEAIFQVVEIKCYS